MGSTEIIIASDDSHEKVIAEIFLEGKFVALLNQDKGPACLEIEFPGPGLVEEQIARKVNLDQFVSAIETAKAKLFGGEKT